MNDAVEYVPWFVDKEIKEGAKIALDVITEMSWGVLNSVKVIFGPKSLIDLFLGEYKEKNPQYKHIHPPKFCRSHERDY